MWAGMAKQVNCNTPKKPNNLKVENSIMKQQGIFYEKIKIHTDAQIINMLKQNQAEESVANLKIISDFFLPIA